MLEFVKMHGLGNDYVYMDAINQSIKNRNELAKKVSDRHFGIGSDGLILICKSNIADFRMQMFNSDGTEAEMCGNGIRCVGKFVYDNGFTNKKKLTIETLAGVKNLELITKDEKVEEVKVDMGEPILEPEKIPVISKENPVKNLNLNLLDRNFLKLSDIELNSMKYKKALIYDKRTFMQYYSSLLKKNHLVFFSFYCQKDYNPQIIKIFLFFFSFLFISQ